MNFKKALKNQVNNNIGSANLTGTGLGMKSPKRRNFESGMLTTDPDFIDNIMQQFDEVWMGNFCKDRGRRDYCGDPIGSL